MEAGLNWTFLCECTVPNEMALAFTQNERAYAAYKTANGFAVITGKRIVMREIISTAHSDTVTLCSLQKDYSLPWKSVDLWSSVDNYELNTSTSIEFLTRAGRISIDLERGIDSRKLNQLISELILA